MRPADWQDFAEMTGGATGALTGLLFVAVSLNATRIAGHQGLRASAAQTLLLFIAPLVMAAVLLAPDQPDWVIGAELIVLGLAASWGLLRIGRAKHTLSDDDKALIAIFNNRTPNIMVMLLFVASGLTLACGQSAGLYLLLPATLVAMLSGILNAWFFLLPPSPAQQSPSHPPAKHSPNQHTLHPHGTARHGADQHGADQHGADQHGAGERDPS
jgi:hypothetical protein